MTEGFEQVTTIYHKQGEPVGVGLLTHGDEKFVCLEQGEDVVHIDRKVLPILYNALLGCEVKAGLRSEMEEEELAEVFA